MNENERLVIVSNRLPYHIDHADDGTPTASRSVGGLTTALGPLHDQAGSLWVGWEDTDDDSDDEIFRAHGCVPIHLSAKDVHSYYDGFSNSTIWPLFHGFNQYAKYNPHTWDSYVHVNEVFRDAILEIAEPGDVYWIQDYQLMLLPYLLREALPDASIGFFLHIPFPDYEGFRLLPWRKEILTGMLGADLIGFHTYDYVRHFISSCRRVLGFDDHYGSFMLKGRQLQTDVFPIGIDYESFANTASSPKIAKVIETFPNYVKAAELKTLLSVERLDYTKGITARLLALDAFFERYPEWIGRLRLMLIAVPSRENVASYNQLKKQVDELVGRINGKYSRLDWTPVEYFYRGFDFEELCALYRASDVLLATPLRDGMNLVCKEYLAAHDGMGGVLVLSEMAGAANELGDALVINPFDQDQLVEAIHTALVMPEEEQIRRNRTMQARLARYTSKKWADDFLNSLSAIKDEQRSMDSRRLSEKVADELVEEYAEAHHRALILDYDGTLVNFDNDPQAVAPDAALRKMLVNLGSAEENSLVILSGRDRHTLDNWFGDLPVTLIAEHGIWYADIPEKGEGRIWQMLEPFTSDWKRRFRPALEYYVDRTPGSFIEEKDYSLVWHYRMVEKDLAIRRAIEIKRELSDNVGEFGLTLMEGNKVIELKPKNVNKGSAAYRWFQDPACDFLLAIGDDTTDEDMFRTAPEAAWTLRVGTPPTLARHTIKNVAAVRELLSRLCEKSSEAHEKS